MKCIISLFTLAIVACSCKEQPKTTQDDKLAELRVHLEERLKAIDPANKVDSVKLISIDTLTQRDKYSLLKEALTDSLERAKLRMEVVAELYTANLRLMNLSKRRSATEYESYRKEAEENKSEVEAIDSVSKQLESQVLYYDSLSSIMQTKAPIGYKAVCLYQLRRRDRSVSMDTASILMNLDKNIVREEDFIKLP
jgi:hypothetical protein